MAVRMKSGAGIGGNFVLTPHKVSVCILLQIYVPPDQVSVPFPFTSVSQHNRLGLFLLALIKSCDDIMEPQLDELINQLKETGGELYHWLNEKLTHKLSSLSSPDDLFNLFGDLQGVLGGPESSGVVDDQIILDPSSHLGIFLRRCLLAFSLLSFEGVCHLLTNIETYAKEALSSCSNYGLPDEDNDLEEMLEYEDTNLESFLGKVGEDVDAKIRVAETFPFHIHAPKSLLELVEEELHSESKIKHTGAGGHSSDFAHQPTDALRGSDNSGGLFLRMNWQVQGYLREQADLIEKHGSSFSLNAFESILQQVQKLAPELHRVHYLRYLNNLYHEDYPAALENLHCYFDYSAGAEGIDITASSPLGCFGRYGIALLCLGMMHSHFGHPKQALEVLTEAVRVSQQHNDDTCLSYTLAAICNLMSEIGISSARGIIGSSYSPLTSFGTSLPIQQQLLVLLRRSLNRADDLKLTRLVASNRLAMEKFDLTHIQRPLLSFGPKSSTKLKTCPASVLKELRLSSYLLGEFGSDGSSLEIDGVFSTAWLKNLHRPMASSVLLEENEPESGYDAFRFGTQPSSIPGSVLQLAGSSYLLRATAWELYGSAPLARLNALVHATCFADASSSSDVALAHVKLIQHQAVFKGYKEAFSALEMAEGKLFSVAKSHMELKTEASLRHARTLLAANQFSQAAAIAHSLFCTCYKFNLQVENATCLLMLADIHKKSGNAVLGLPYALASLSFCQSFNLDLLEASATLTLADLWLSLGSNHAKRALTLIHRALPMILGNGGLELRARANIAVVKCYLSDPSFSVSEDSEMVLDSLKQAAEELQILEYNEMAAEAFYLMAMVYDKLGQLEEREEAASSFKKHVIAFENPHDDNNPLF
ncbi:hypothetical protein C5167_049056 [Papaver somniferum]|uniref:Anaphase-promoting complex subunit 5 n=1 Tax=Papaver somniferum TaxID=3469 RepID=A0A4Y7KJP3_PAPSO|nr:hypothetical protein C5167_049056 [Papaver somniferum]